MQPLRSPAERRTGKFELRTVATPDRPIPRSQQDARALHARAQLWVAAEILDADQAAQDHWSARRRLAVIIGGSLALWTGLIFGGWLLIRSF